MFYADYISDAQMAVLIRKVLAGCNGGYETVL
jgi:hypothetical protein